MASEFKSSRDLIYKYNYTYKFQGNEYSLLFLGYTTVHQLRNGAHPNGGYDVNEFYKDCVFEARTLGGSEYKYLVLSSGVVDTGIKDGLFWFE